MRFVLAALAGYVLLYAPGHYLLRRAQSTAGEASRLLREVLLSASCTSWIGFLLAELGWFSLPLLLALLGGVAFTAWGLARGTPRRGYGSRDAIGLAVWVCACVWIAPPFDTRLVAADSSGYLASGVQLARHGTLVIHDPTLAHLSVDLKRGLFPSVAPERGAPPYLRLSGSLILRSLDSDEVLPAFHHLITVWIAAADAVAGFDAGEWIITLFGGLSIWAIVECAALLGAATPLVLPLLLLSGIQYWYSRFLMPEVAGQFFLWAGLACVASHERSARAADAALAGFAFGIAGLVRPENAGFLLVALTIAFLLTPRTGRRHFAVLLGCATVVWLHAGVHLAVFQTHYFGILRWLLGGPLGLGGERVHLILLAVLVIGTLLLWRANRSEWARCARPVCWGALVCLLFLSLWSDYRTHWSSLQLLVSCIGAPILLGGGAGLLILLTNGNRPRLASQLLVVLTAIVFAQVMIQPHAQPIPIWTARRALTIVLPAACVGLALLCHIIVQQRWHWAAAALVFCGALLGESRLLWQLRSRDYYRGAARHVEAIAALVEPGSTLLIDGQLVALHLAPTLWARHELPTYLFPAADTARIVELASTLGERPLYWVSNGDQPLPHGPGIDLTPVALYEFTFTTPMLDIGAPLGSAANWQEAIALYRFRSIDHR